MDHIKTLTLSVQTLHDKAQNHIRMYPTAFGALGVIAVTTNFCALNVLSLAIGFYIAYIALRRWDTFYGMFKKEWIYRGEEKPEARTAMDYMRNLRYNFNYTYEKRLWDMHILVAKEDLWLGAVQDCGLRILKSVRSFISE